MLDALDIRLEPKYNSDIVPIALTAKGAINQRSSKVADENIIYQLIEHNKKNFIETASHIMDGHTEVAPLKYKQVLPCQFCNYKSVCHVDGLIDSKRYRTVDESIKPLDLIQQLRNEGGEDMIPTKPHDVIWTDAQWQNIYAKGQDILVAAAAGSGKTAVLVERIIQHTRDDVDVDRLLVVTFTNLSAREMKHRVDKRIQEASFKDLTMNI